MAPRIPLGGLRSPSEKEWEDKKPIIKNLYIIKDYSRRKVMEIMTNEHNFVASKSQYESRFKKWEWSKNFSMRDWQDIAHCVQQNTSDAVRTTVVVNGREKSAAAVRKNFKRSRRFMGQLQIQSSVLPPKGVSIRRTCIGTSSTETIELPSHIFEELLRRFCTTNNLEFLDSTPSLSSESGIWQFRNSPSLLRECFIASQPSFYPLTLSNRLAPSTTFFYFRLISSVANNFAGTKDRFAATKILSVLSHEIKPVLLDAISENPRCYAMRALAKNMLLASIDSGDSETLIYLLYQCPVDVQVDRMIHKLSGRSPSIFQEALARGHHEIIQAILWYASSTDSQTSSLLLQEIWRALLYLTRGQEDQYMQAARLSIERIIAYLDIDQISQLVETADHAIMFLLEFFRRADLTGKIMLPYMEKHMATKSKDWLREDVFCQIFKLQDAVTCSAILQIMTHHGVELKDVDTFRIGKPLMDVVIPRGDLTLVKELVAAGAEFTKNTLKCAIESGNVDMVAWVLDSSSLSSIWNRWTSLLSAAVAADDVRIFDTVASMDEIVQSERRSGYLAELLLDVTESVNRSARLDILYAKLDAMPIGDLLYAQALRAIHTKNEQAALNLIRLIQDTGLSTLKQEASLILQALLWGNKEVLYAIIALLPDPRRLLRGQLPFKLMELAVSTGDAWIVRTIIPHCRLHHREDDEHYRGSRDGYLGQSSDERSTLSTLASALKLIRTEMIDLLLELFEDHAGFRYMNQHMSRVMIGYNGSADEVATMHGTMLCAAVETGECELVSYVLEHCRDFWSLAFALRIAYKNSNTPVLQMLQDFIRDRSSFRRLCWATEKVLVDAIEEDDYDLFRILLDSYSGVKFCSRSRLPDGRYGRFTTVFGRAIQLAPVNRLDYVELLLRRKEQDCHSQVIASQGNISNETALLVAIGTGYQPMVELFLDHGAAINAPTNLNTRRTPLQKAAETGNEDIVRLLLMHGADTNAPAARVTGGTALQLAAIGGFFNIVQLLLSKGADINAPGSIHTGRRDLEGLKALERAAESGRLDVVALLVHKGHQIFQNDKSQVRRAADRARAKYHDEVADMLSDYERNGVLSYVASDGVAQTSTPEISAMFNDRILELSDGDFSLDMDRLFYNMDDPLLETDHHLVEMGDSWSEFK